MNFPIFLTWLRILAIPVLFFLYYLPVDWFFNPIVRDIIAAFIFIFAAITDWLDGWLARKLNQTSDFGAFLDPVADKLMVCTALLILLDLARVELFIVLIIVGREITISALREWMASVGKRNSVAVNWLGKFKTTAQMIAIPCLFLNHAFYFNFLSIGSVLILIAAVLTLWSMFYYLYQAWLVMRK